MEKDRFVTCEVMKVYFEVPEGLPDEAWAGIIPASVSHGSEETNDDNDIRYAYLGGRASGSVTLEQIGRAHV